MASQQGLRTMSRGILTSDGGGVRAPVETVMAVVGTVQTSVFQNERLVQQGTRAGVTGKAVWACVPVQGIVGDAGGVGSYRALTGAADLGRSHSRG